MPWLFNFAKEFLKICLKDKTKSHELLSMIGLQLAEQQSVVKLMVWAGQPQPDSVKGQKIFTKDLLRGTLFLADFKFFNLVSIVL